MMKHAPVRSSLLALLSGALLAACGGAPEAELEVPEAALGTQESALCSGTSVSSLTIAGVSSWGGEVAGSGNWTVAGGANAVHLDYLVDGVVRTTEDRTGTSGTWYFSYNPVSCGSHTFQVKAYPVIIDSGGNRTYCPSSGPQNKTSNFTQACATSNVSCNRTSSTYITCTGSASGGAGSPYTPFWQYEVQRDDGSTYTSAWAQGALTRTFYCPQTFELIPADVLEVRFKARDASGMDSYISYSFSHFCQAGSY